MNRSRATVFLVAIVSTTLFASSASSQCVSGTLTSAFQSSGPHAGLWKYTLDFTWDTTQGLSNITLDCGFGGCPEEACAQTYEFDDPAGQSDGVPAGCTVDYEGEFNCNGNPSIGITDPILKWDALDTGSCEPGAAGTGQVSFYSNRSPQTGQAPMVLVKNGQQVCQGMAIGDCPAMCFRPVSVEDRSWGETKSNYR